MKQKEFNYLILGLLIIIIISIFITNVDWTIPPSTTTTIPTTTVPTLPSFTDYDLEQGWYYGDINQRKPGTPKHWLHSAEGTRSARWFNPVTGNEDYCAAILRASETIEETISKFCDNNDECESREYVGSLTNAVKCFSKENPVLADYDYAFELYRELDCPLSMGGAPYANAYCECIDGICTALLET